VGVRRLVDHEPERLVVGVGVADRQAAVEPLHAEQLHPVLRRDRRLRAAAALRCGPRSRVLSYYQVQSRRLVLVDGAAVDGQAASEVQADVVAGDEVVGTGDQADAVADVARYGVATCSAGCSS